MRCWAAVSRPIRRSWTTSSTGWCMCATGWRKRWATRTLWSWAIIAWAVSATMRKRSAPSAKTSVPISPRWSPACARRTRSAWASRTISSTTTGSSSPAAIRSPLARRRSSPRRRRCTTPWARSPAPLSTSCWKTRPSTWTPARTSGAAAIAQSLRPSSSPSSSPTSTAPPATWTW